MNKTIQNTLQLTDEYTDYAKKVIIDCIAHEVYNAVARGEDHIYLDLGFMTLSLYFSSGKVTLAGADIQPIVSGVNAVLIDGKDPLTEELEHKLDAAVSNLYKELL